jgi:hypothetical protein
MFVGVWVLTVSIINTAGFLEPAASIFKVEDSSILKMEATDSSETLLLTYKASHPRGS